MAQAVVAGFVGALILVGLALMTHPAWIAPARANELPAALDCTFHDGGAWSFEKGAFAAGLRGGSPESLDFRFNKRGFKPGGYAWFQKTRKGFADVL